jgi:hypothetical protein
MTADSIPLHKSRTQFWIFLLVALVASACYEGTHLYRGWVPHDEGCLTESALRVMHGQLPHRDYVEIYTGGLAYLDALTFRLLGLRFVNLRIVLFAFFVIWVAVVYWTAANLAAAWIAAAITFFAVLWSVPNYSAAMPSWYNLFFATFGTAAIFQYVRARSTGWLFLAGLCAGISFLVKIAGLYFLAALLLYCVYREQDLSAESPGASPNRPSAYSVFVMSGLALFATLVFWMVHRGARSGEYLHFVFPVAAICGYLVRREFVDSFAKSGVRFRRILLLTLPVVGGFSAPVLIFLIPYIRSHSVHALVAGLFVLPFQRLSNASVHALPLIALPFAFIVAGPLAFAFSETGPVRKILSVTGASILALLVAFSFTNTLAYRLVWNTIAWTIPILTLFAIARLWSHAGTAPGPSSLNTERFIALVIAAILCSLIQFPYAISTYFCYISPLAILAIAGLIATLDRPPRFFLGATAVSYAVYAAFAFTPGFIDHMGLQYAPEQQSAAINASVAEGLRVYQHSAFFYNRLVPLVKEHLSGGALLAGPDCPEVYVLSGADNPTPTPFDFFEPLDGYDQMIQDVLRANQVQVIVVDNRPQFSSDYVHAMRRALGEAFLVHESIGDFDVYWRR